MEIKSSKILRNELAKNMNYKNTWGYNIHMLEEF